MPSKYLCRDCSKVITATTRRRYRTHTNGDGDPCVEGSGKEIPADLEPVEKGSDPGVPTEGHDFATCPQCERKVKLTRLGYFEPHDDTLKGGNRCPVSGVRAKHARKTETVASPLVTGDPEASPVPKVRAQDEVAQAPSPESTGSSGTTPTAWKGEIDWSQVGDLKELPRERVAELDKVYVPPVESSASTDSPSPASSTTSEPSPAPEPSTSSDVKEEGADVGPFHLAPNLSREILQPFSHILQPFEVPPRVKLAGAMSVRGKEIAGRLREVFYAYTNRDHSSNRSAQKTLGPSEAGSPCDRQIAMKLMRVRPVNPQEGWAPFVGTAVHVELAKMFEWANGSGSGRYITEMPLTFGSQTVQRGTADLLDRVLLMILDHKLMGRWSLDKLIQNGPSETYRIQGQIYALGAVLAGEKVKEVAIVGWPRQESSLDKLYVHVEPFDRKLAEAALKRVERIAETIEPGAGIEEAKAYAVADDCKWCPFYLPKDKEMKRGCPGK